MICKKCNRELSESMQFCPVCGTKKENLNNPYSQMHNDNVIKSKNGVIITLAVVSGVLFVCIIIVMSFLMFSDSDSKIEDTVSPVVTQQPFDRLTTYSSAYYYKNMPEIHNTVSATDEECFELETVIYDYNQKWLNFVNNNDTSIYANLRYGTKAYEYAMKYSSKNIVESYQLLDVNDVRTNGNYYYVWTHEIITETSMQGSENLEYHWVYKIGKDGSGYYVENYTADPYYK